MRVVRAAKPLVGPTTPHQPTRTRLLPLRRGISPLILAALPPFALIVLVLQYQVDIPYWDAWDLVPLLEKSYEGNLTVADLWAQHNEHRPVFPSAIQVLLARATGWNTTAELAVNIGVAAVTFLLISSATVRALRSLDIGSLPVIALISPVVFSLAQWENWLWGFTLEIFLSVLASVAGLFMLSRQPLTATRLLGSLLCGIVATYSFGSGIAYWPVGLVLLLATPLAPGATRKRFALVWLIVAAVTSGSYAYDYRAPPWHPSPWTVLEQPLEFGKYVLTYLGAPIVSKADYALWAGTVGLVLLAATGFTIFRQLRPHIGVCIPFVALAACSVGNALVTGVGRVGFGFTQAMAPRYTTISYLFRVPIVVFLYILVKTTQGRTQVGYLAVQAVLLIMIVGNSLANARFFIARYEQLAPARAELLSVNVDSYITRDGPRTADQLREELHVAGYLGWDTAAPDELYNVFQGIGGGSSVIKRLLPDEKLLKERLETLRKRHLAVFRHELEGS